MNRAHKRREIRAIEVDVVDYAKRIVLLDETIKSLKEHIETIDEKDELAIAQEKLGRLILRSQTIGEKYDDLVKSHVELMGSLGLVSSLGKMIEPDASTDNETPGVRQDIQSA